ncbi:putative protein N(5)-glutamine methyltransferase [Microbacterium sp. MPKO10]|uniref:putative protein N(5)-glutamine methyltransferase n=1 Tax=Microbacterium sp. MPKO10 TaxID=2989818 RepID=UPI002235BCA6|nr:putative protein N(5)-glutamine methyltransferase [Microbacterium sp. MPKO10]MCW4457184.1 putative protein N(5)-glutamine methyltransferase [Microbacterium sp. MPKO10]
MTAQSVGGQNVGGQSFDGQGDGGQSFDGQGSGSQDASEQNAAGQDASGRDAGELTLRLRAAGCVFAEDEAALFLDAARDEHDLERMVQRRVAGEAPEHIVGFAEFCGLRIAVVPGVFIPRQRSAALVDQAALLCRADSVVVDMCCGSGALGRAIAERVPGITLHAADSDPLAVACAVRNLAGVGTASAGDLTDALPDALRGRIDVMVANVPYVPSAALPLMPAEARDHEPRATHDGGSDGLDVFRRLTSAAAEWLAPGGSTLSEISDGQVDAALAACSAANLRGRTVYDDDRETTIVIGTLSEQPRP